MGLRALIVDDSPSARAQARSALEDVMERRGVDWDVDEAGSGVEALRALASSDVELLIVDLHMPDMTGLEVLAFWRSRGEPGAEGRRALVVSTDVSARDKEKALDGGAHRFLEKPLSGDALADALVGFGTEGVGT